MGRTCTICSHPRRNEIESDLLAQVSYRDIAARHGVSPSALTRHMDGHISEALIAVKAKRDDADALSLLAQTDALLRKVEAILDKALEDGKSTTALAAIREARGMLELRGKVTGELREAPSVVFNLVASPEWRSVQAAILRALTPYDEALAAVVAALSAHDALPEHAIPAEVIE